MSGRSSIVHRNKIMLIIDGYNVLMQMGLRGKSLEEKRGRFIKTLDRRHKMFGGITVVFDGKGEVFIYPKREKFNINVVYTKDGSADDWIKSIIEKSRLR